MTQNAYSDKTKKRVNFYIDGWNVYLGLRDHIGLERNERQTDNPKGQDFRWCNYRKLCENVCKRKWGNQAEIGIIYFFTTVTRVDRSIQTHCDFRDAMEHYGLEVVEGRFQYDPENKKDNEKETDVNITIRMVVDALVDKSCDVCVLLSADSDFTPVLKEVSDLSEREVQTIVMIPLGNSGNEKFKKSADEWDEITVDDFEGTSLPDVLPVPNRKDGPICIPSYCEGGF